MSTICEACICLTGAITNGVVMEGLYDTYEARPDEGAEYKNYVLEYLNAMLVTDENGVHHLK